MPHHSHISRAVRCRLLACFCRCTECRREDATRSLFRSRTSCFPAISKTARYGAPCRTSHTISPQKKWLELTGSHKLEGRVLSCQHTWHFFFKPVYRYLPTYSCRGFGLCTTNIQRHFQKHLLEKGLTQQRILSTKMYSVPVPRPILCGAAADRQCRACWYRRQNRMPFIMLLPPDHLDLSLFKICLHRKGASQ